MSENDDSFRDFFAGCRTELSRAAFFLAGDALAAEDLLQDALVKTAARWDKVKTLAAPEAYVRTIMLNTVRSRWRRRQRKPSTRRTTWPIAPVARTSKPAYSTATSWPAAFARWLRASERCSTSGSTST